jgi:hypothetical protein
MKPKNMRTEYVTITPAMAKEMLEKNKTNRDIKEYRITHWVKLMESQDWYITHQGLAFYEDGTLADGQHRLLAIIKVNRPVTFLVTYGLPRAAAMAIDSGVKRSLIDGIKISGIADWIEARHLQLAPVIGYPRKLSDMQRIDFLYLIKEHAQFAVQCFPSNRRHLVPSIVQSAIAMAHHHGEDEAKLIRFCEVFFDGLMSDPSERVIILARDHFMNFTNNGAKDKDDKYLKLQRAIQAYCKGEQVRRLIQPTDPIYPADHLF